jgi:hypothetical protein
MKKEVLTMCPGDQGDEKEIAGEMGSERIHGSGLTKKMRLSLKRNEV